MKSCPSTTAFMQIASNKLNCTRPEVYHCVPDQQNRLREICVRRSWIQAGHCPVYSQAAKSLSQKTCNSTLGICPEHTYWSNKASTYSACTFTKRGDSNDINTETESDGTDVHVALIVIPIIILIVVICIALGVAVYIRKRRRQQEDTREHGENTGPLLHRTDHEIIIEEKRKEEHLKKEEACLKFFISKGMCTKNRLQRIREHLQNNKNVFIVGKPGSGKTTLAWTVCKQLHNEISKGKRWYVTVSTDTDNIPDGNKITLLLLDGRFESAWTTEGTVEKILEEVREFRSQLPTRQFFIMVTISQQAYRRIEKYACIQMLKPWGIINLDDERNSLTIVEMSNVFETYDISIQNNTETYDRGVLSEDQLRLVYECFRHHSMRMGKRFAIPNLGFPLIASLMAINYKFLGSIDFVKKPIKHILKSIRQLRESGQQSDNNKYCTLVYAAFNGGYVDINNVNKDMMQKIGNFHSIQDAIIDTNFYLLRERTGGVLEFVHESLMQAFLAAYGRQYLGFVARHCPMDVLLEYSVLEMRQNEEKPFNIFIGGPDFIKILVQRIMHENIEISHHGMWKATYFRNIYIKMYAKKDEL